MGQRCRQFVPAPGLASRDVKDEDLNLTRHGNTSLVDPLVVDITVTREEWPAIHD